MQQYAKAIVAAVLASLAVVVAALTPGTPVYVAVSALIAALTAGYTTYRVPNKPSPLTSLD